MKCSLSKNFLRPIMVKQRKMILSSKKRDSSTSERIYEKEIFESQSTMESERLFTLSKTQSVQTLNTERESKQHNYYEFEDHPSYLGLSGSQYLKFKEFKTLAYHEFIILNCTISDIEQVCLDDLNLLRFWIARNFKLNAVMKMWLNWVNWRIEFRPDLLKKNDVKSIPLQKYFKIHKTDKEGRTLVLLKPGFFEKEINSDDCMKVWIYIIEKAWRKSDRNADGKISVIFDRKNMSQKKDKKWMPVYKLMGQYLQDYYPERLQNAFIVNSNWIIHLILSIVKVFLSKSTKEKLWIIKNKNLEKYIYRENIPAEYL